MALDPSKYRVTGDTEFTPELWNRVMEQFALAIVEIQEKATSFDEATKQLIQTALFRINEALAPAFELVLDYQTGGFLTAPIAENSEVTFEVGESTLAIHADNLTLFRPSPFIVLTRESTTADIAVARRVSYDTESGALEYEIVSVEGSAGPHDDVIVTATAGSAQAQAHFLAETKAARDAAQGHAGTAASQATTATTQAGMATTKAGEAATSKTGADNAKAAAESARDAALLAKSAAEDAAEAAATFDPGNYLTATETGEAISDAVAGKANTSHTHTLAALTDVAAASVTDLLAGTANKLVVAAIVKDATAWLALTDATTVAIDWSARAAFEVTLQGNRALGNPTNVVAGQTRYLLLKGNNTTDRAPTFGSNYKGDLPSISDVDDTRWYLLTLVAIATDHIAVSGMRALGT